MGQGTRKKPGGRKKSNRKRPGKGGGSAVTHLKRAALGLALLLLLVVAAGLLVHHGLKRGPQPAPVPPGKIARHPAPRIPAPQTPERSPAASAPAPEKAPARQWEESKLHAALPPIRPKPPEPGKIPRVAIIIDDLGYDTGMAKRLFNLETPLTFSILPQSPFQKRIADMARGRGREIMLHLPMEPLEYPSDDPGPGALLSGMTPDELTDLLQKDLDSVPGITGVNNHMGSRMTTDSDRLNQIFTILKKRNLFFIDSYTNAQSLCRSSARLLRIPFAQRDIFLDHVQESDFIRKQLAALLRIARKKGEAVGIAHPHPITVDLLEQLLPELQKEVELVPASWLVRIPEE